MFIHIKVITCGAEKQEIQICQSFMAGITVVLVGALQDIWGPAIAHLLRLTWAKNHSEINEEPPLLLSELSQHNRQIRAHRGIASLAADAAAQVTATPSHPKKCV